MVARWNELEFSILLYNTAGQAAWNTMSRVQTALSVPIKIDISGEQLELKPLIGISEFCPGDTVSDLTDNASRALDLAKNSGGTYLHTVTD
jgi:PleD family two-component response regulator